MLQNSILIFCCYFLALFALNNANDIVNGIEKCLYNDACLKNSIQATIDKYGNNGLKELGLVPLDPLHVTKLKLAKNQKSPVSIDLTFSDVDLLGLSSAKIKKVQGLTEGLKNPIDIEVFLPKVSLKGPYEIDGRVLILPIVGKGISEIKMQNTLLHARVKFNINKKSGEDYAEVTSFQLKLEPELVQYRFEGLFNGQKDLSDNMHVFINENWSDIFNELKPDLSEALSLIYKQILNNVFSKRSVAALFGA